MCSYEVDPAVAWLSGFLDAFAWFINKTNHVCTFTVDVLSKPATVQHAPRVK
jgi:hypothetical protein